MKKMLWSKLKFRFTNAGRHDEKEEDKSSLMSKSKVNEEYKQASRTKSYIEMYNKVHDQLETTRSTSLDEGELISSPSFSPNYVHLSKYSLEPHIQETSSILHQLLLDYFEISQDACLICESLLTSIHQTRNNHRLIKNVMKSVFSQVPDVNDWTHDQCHAHDVYKNLVSFASRKNPFSTLTPKKFHDIHDGYVTFLHEVMLKLRNTKRRTKIIRLVKKAMGGCLVIGCSALAVALLVLAMHCVVGLAAVPWLAAWSLGRLKMEKTRRKFNEKWLQGLTAKLDVAARGVYIMINDFDTMSRIMKRLNDEIEHRKYVADICVRKMLLGKNEMLMKELVREFQKRESSFVEDLEELEMQIYLCLLDISRSRRVLIREMHG